MSTFIVRFIGEVTENSRGKVRHVSTGEEITFTNFEELKDFFESLTIVNGLGEATCAASGSRKLEADETNPM